MAQGPLIGTAWLKPDYRSALERAGARIRELTPGDPLPGSLAECDGLLLTGGVDVEPTIYGEDRHPTVESDDTRDSYELALAREALQRDLPVLAICRGAQVLNVAAGGTLIQDIPSSMPGAADHQIDQPKNAVAHEVVVESGTCLAHLLEGRVLVKNERRPVHENRDGANLQDVDPKLMPERLKEAKAVYESNRCAVVVHD